MIFAGKGCRGASSSSTSTSVLDPVFVRRICGKPNSVKQNLAQLLRRIDVERMPGQLVDLRLQLGHPLAILPTQLLQQRHVDPHATELHVGQHFDQRHLQLVEQRIQAIVSQSIAEDLGKPQRNVGVLRRRTASPATPGLRPSAAAFRPVPISSRMRIVS